MLTSPSPSPSPFPFPSPSRFGDSGSRVLWCEVFDKIVEGNEKLESSDVEAASSFLPEAFRNAIRSTFSSKHNSGPSPTRSSFNSSSAKLSSPGGSFGPSSTTAAAAAAAAVAAVSESSKSSKNESSSSFKALTPLKDIASKIPGASSDLFVSRSEQLQRQQSRRNSALAMSLSETLQSQRAGAVPVRGVLPGVSLEALEKLQQKHEKRK